MSTTTTALTSTTLVGILPTMTGATVITSEKQCPTCGQDIAPSPVHSADEARRRIRELESQVQFLTVRSTQTAEKMAEYEDEVRRLRSQAKAYSQSQRNGTSISSISSARSDSLDKPLSPTQLSTSPSSQPSQSRLSTLTSLLPYRRPSATPSVPPVPAQQATTVLESTLELQNALNREQNLRKAAETQLTQTNMELEELTAQLFGQANEMVAQERKARAKLEERVALLERRDVEKRKRLDRLEKSIERVERLRALVGQ